MNLQIDNERSDNVPGMDIYDLSWYTIYQMEVQGKPSARYNITHIYSCLRALIEENKEFLHILLYDKELAVGVLLGYYVLLKSKSYDERYLQQELSRVLKVIKSYINEYATEGEILYALKKLDMITGIIREFIDVNNKIVTLFNELKDTLLRGSPRIEDAEDLSYVIWIIYETETYNKSKEQDMLKIVLDDRLYDLVTMDYKSVSIYGNAFSNFVLKGDLKLEGEVYNVLYERAEELIKTLKYYAEMFKQKNDEKVSTALVSKLNLGIYHLEKALQKLRTLDEVQRIKRKYDLYLVITIASIIAFINVLPVTYQVILPFLFSYRNIITIILSSVLIYKLDNLFFKRKISKLISEFAKVLLKVVEQHSHS